MYRTLAKKRPWAVHLTLGSNWGVGGHSRNHRCILTRKSAQVYTLRSYTCTYVRDQHRILLSLYNYYIPPKCLPTTHRHVDIVPHKIGSSSIIIIV